MYIHNLHTIETGSTPQIPFSMCLAYREKNVEWGSGSRDKRGVPVWTAQGCWQDQEPVLSNSNRVGAKWLAWDERWDYVVICHCKDGFPMLRYPVMNYLQTVIVTRQMQLHTFIGDVTHSSRSRWSLRIREPETWSSFLSSCTVISSSLVDPGTLQRFS